MKKIVILSISLCLVLPLVRFSEAQGVKPGIRDVFLYDQAAKETKTRCREVMGRYDSTPSYECKDAATGKWGPIDPGNKWKVVYADQKCLRNKVRGDIKTGCAAFRVGKDPIRYLCPGKDGEMVPFDLKDAWEPLNDNDPLCQPVKFGEEVIKHFEFDVTTELKKSDGKDGQK